ncbi:MAG: hypothetical protein K8S27_16070 [Candidatus Omnitrophica bacterium]|nr:hypothetical protein [Candidatus Omnitrophota bacterium]
MRTINIRKENVAKSFVWSLFLFVFGACFFTASSRAKTLASFESEINFEKKQLNFYLKLDRAEKIAVKLKMIHKDSYEVTVDIDHLKFFSYDFSSIIQSRIERTPAQEDISPQENLKERTRHFLSIKDVKGNIVSDYTLLNFQPLRDLIGQFEIKDSQFYLSRLSFGPVTCSGHIDLFYPFTMDLDIKINAVAMRDFLTFWGVDREYDSSGFVIGEIKALGTWGRLDLKGRLQSRDGYVGALKFNRLYLVVDGTYPKLDVNKESRIYQTNGLSFTYEGPFDLAKRSSFESQLENLIISPIIEDSESEVEWTLKRIGEDETITMELKYQLRKNGRKGILNEDNSDMFGIERSMKF